MLKKIKRIFKTGELWRRVELLEADNYLMKEQINDLNSRIEKAFKRTEQLEKRTISYRTQQTDIVLPRQIFNEWLNGEDNTTDE